MTKFVTLLSIFLLIYSCERQPASDNYKEKIIPTNKLYNTYLSEYNTEYDVDLSIPISEWRKFPYPEYDSIIFKESPISHWRVLLKNDQIMIEPKNIFFKIQKYPFEISESKKNNFGGNLYFHQVEDGWLVGVNKGEFGGSLWWFSKNKKQFYKISELHIKGFIQVNGQVYAIEGISHMGPGHGSLIKIYWDRNKKKWISQTFLVLPEAPYAALFDKRSNHIYIVLGHILVKVSLEGKLKVIFQKDKFHWLGANSIVMDSNKDIYIGMNIGVVKLSNIETQPKLEWFIPTENYFKQVSEQFDKIIQKYYNEREKEEKIEKK